MPTTQPKNDSATRVFISYAAADREFAHRLSEDLAAAGFEVWNDEQELEPGDVIQAALASAITSANAIIVLVSSATIASSWVNRELALALSTWQRNPQLRLIPVLIESGVEVPFVLRSRLYVDLSSPELYTENLPRLIEGLQRHRKAISVDELARLYLSPELNQSIDQIELNVMLAKHSRTVLTRITIALLLVLLTLLGVFLMTYDFGAILLFVAGVLTGTLANMLVTMRKRVEG